MNMRATNSGATNVPQLPLSPEQIRSIELPRTSLSRRGYQERAVHRLIDRFAADAERWTAETRVLRAENVRIKAALTQWQSEVARRDGVPTTEQEVEAEQIL